MSESKRHVFDPVFQQSDLSSKIVVGLERISEAFRALLWEHAKVIGLSPIQIQILIFVSYHKEELNNVSHLAREFNVTKPTISDAIKVLLNKGLLQKEVSSTDSRSYSVHLSKEGEEVVAKTEQFVAPIHDELRKMSEPSLEGIYESLTHLISNLNRSGILSVQRTCYGCKFYEKQMNGHFCHFLNHSLQNQEIRLDCPEFERV